MFRALFAELRSELCSQSFLLRALFQSFVSGPPFQSSVCRFFVQSFVFIILGNTTPETDGTLWRSWGLGYPAPEAGGARSPRVGEPTGATSIHSRLEKLSKNPSG